MPDGPTIGLLLAAGRGSRFDPTGRADKLLAMVAGQPAVLRALAALSPAVDQVVAVVRPDARGAAVAAVLARADCTALPCADAESGMGHSLACAAAEARRRGAARVVVMLGDLPFVRTDTVARVVAAVAGPDAIAVPTHGGERGHPVAFGAAHLPALAQASGDRGAGALLRSHPVTTVDVDDPGIRRDVDTPADLETPEDHA